jgi:outer membrane protein TolC
MILARFTRNLIYLVMCGVVGLCAPAGCTGPDYKKDADERVYKIIDQKWKDEFGPKANYKISDVAPSPNDIVVEKAVPASGVLTLPQAVAIATAHNRDYQTQKEELYAKALDLRLVRHQFEPQFFAGGGAGYSRDRDDEVFGIDPRFGFNQLLSSGGTINAAIRVVWADVMAGNLRSGLAQVLTATVTQPLLRGSDRKVVLEDLTQAERDVLYQIRSFNRFRKTFVVSIITQYYSVLQKYDAVKNARRNYNTLAWLCERVETLAGAGRLPKLELEQLQEQRLEALDLYILREKKYKDALDEFKIVLGLPTTAEFQLDESELEALRAARMDEPNFSQAEAIETALYRRLDLINSADTVIDAQRKVYVAADGLRADLNITGTVGDSTSRPADWRELGSLRRERGVGVDLDLPLDRVAEQNVYRQALLVLNQKQRKYEQMADTIEMEIRRSFRDLVEAARRYRVQLASLELDTKRIENTFLLMQYGRASSRRVLNAQDALLTAQDAATEALVTYAVATLNFYRDTEVLQVRPDGMWEPAARLTSAKK